MDGSTYALGVDIGDCTVTAAVHALDGPAPEPLPAVDDLPPAARLISRMASVAPPVRTGAPDATTDEFSAVIRQIVTLASKDRGTPPARTVVTVPPSWGAYRRRLLAESLSLTTPGPCALVSGAVAAVREHAALGQVPDRASLLVLDLGASTLDAAVVGPGNGGGWDHVAVPAAPLAWGGRDGDDAVLGLLRRSLADAAFADDDRAAALRRAATAIKEALSADTVADLPTTVSGSAGPVRVTREEYEELLEPGVRLVVDAAAEAVSAAGLTTETLHGVVLAGGAARMPVVAERVSARFGLPLLVGDDPAVTAARGAARLGVDDLRAHGPATDSDPAPAGEPGRRHREPGRPPTSGAASGRASTSRPGQRTGRRGAAGLRTRRTVIAGSFLLTFVALPWSLVGAFGPGTVSASGAGAALAGTPAPAATPVPEAPSPADQPVLDLASDAGAVTSAARRPATASSPGGTKTAVAATTPTSIGAASAAAPATPTPAPPPPPTLTPTPTDTAAAPPSPPATQSTTDPVDSSSVPPRVVSDPPPPSPQLVQQPAPESTSEAPANSLTTPSATGASTSAAQPSGGSGS